MLHGNGWQGHLTKNEFDAKFRPLRAEPLRADELSGPGAAAAAAAAGAAQAQNRLVPQPSYRASAWWCFDPRNTMPCHGFDLIGALYGLLWVAYITLLVALSKGVLLWCL
jgi:hypothetical protein